MSGTRNPAKINDRKTLLFRVNKNLQHIGLRADGENWGELIEFYVGKKSRSPQWIIECRDRWNELTK